MVANVRGYTHNYNFKLINFDTPRWHTLEYANWSQVDAMFLQVGAPSIRGEWQNGTLYLIGERVFDAQTSDLYRCLVEHTSAAGGTFAQDRANNPSFWVIQTLGVPLFRYEWTPNQVYTLGDLVVVDDYKYYLCVVTHTSSLTFPPDVTFWTLVFDGTATVQAANDYATDAAGSQAAAAVSETNAAASAASALASKNSAATSETNAATSATNAANSASAASTSETNAAASAVTAANQADALRGTSLTSNSIAIGSKTFTTQAGKQFNVGNYVTIVATVNPTGQMMTGQITSYSGTTLIVDVNGLLGAGTIADWQIYVSGAQGQKGADGSGGGGIADAPADGNIYARLNNAWTQTIKKSGDSMTGHLGLPTGPSASQAVRKDYVDNATSYTPSGNIAATTVQGAIAELDTEKVAKAGDTMTGHLALPTGPAAANAVRKDYVDAADSALSSAIALKADTSSIPTAATAAEYIANSQPTKMLTPGAVWTAAGSVSSITESSGTATPDFSLGLDFAFVFTGTNRTMANPINVKTGQKGLIYFFQDATGNRLISTWGSNWKFPGGSKPVLSTTPGAMDILSFSVPNNPALICCTFMADVK